jgi:hypothetical protein
MSAIHIEPGAPSLSIRELQDYLYARIPCSRNLERDPNVARDDKYGQKKI